MSTPGTLVKKKWLLSTPSGTKAVMLQDWYDTINTKVGLTEAPAGDMSPTDGSRELIKSIQAIAILITQKRSNGTYKRSKILCDIQNASAGLSSLIGDTYNGLPIINAYIPSRRRLG